jgi:hypothetical protein
MKKTFFALALSLASTSALAAVEIKGTLSSVDMNAGTYTIESLRDSKSYTLEFSDKTRVHVDGKTHKQLDALKEGDVVVYRKSLPAPVRYQVPATVNTIDRERSIITFTDENGNIRSLPFKKGAKVYNRFSRFLKVENLREGDEVQLELTKSVKAADSLVLAN